MGIRIDVVVDYPVNDEVERVLGLAEAVGEPVTVTFVWEGGKEAERAVLVPAATLALWEHWAPTAYEAFRWGREAACGGGAGAGPSGGVRRVHALSSSCRRRTAVARAGVVVAELLNPDEAHWLQEQSRGVREGFMDPRQRAAFEEFLARQAALDEQ
ncbi:hypothetical protein [Streptomyces misionensis]|uniref:hypothetical protein n=1 Tax=Streptomyces misionensis TaxID=67331 RepID=UPI00396BA014